LHEGLQQLPENLTKPLGKIIEDSQISTRRIATVLRVLQQVVTIELTTYHGNNQMIDIEAALHEELKLLATNEIADKQ
jgi:chorismate-pyruvate lyase